MRGLARFGTARDLDGAAHDIRGNPVTNTPSATNTPPYEAPIVKKVGGVGLV